MSLYEHFPKFLGFMDHPLSPMIVLIVGFTFLWWTSTDRRKFVQLYGSDHQPIPSKVNPALLAGLTWIVIGVAFALAYATYHVHQSGFRNRDSSQREKGAIVFVDDETPLGVRNGVNRVFTLSTRPDPPVSLNFRINGLAQIQGLSYDLNGSTITIRPTSAAPVQLDALVASYRR